MSEQTKQTDKTQKELLSREEEKILYWIGFFALPIGAISIYAFIKWIVPYMAFSECVFWQWLGVYCPGCGGTRALIALTQGHFILSAWYHPLVMYTFVLYTLYMITHTLEKLHVPFVKGMRFRSWYMYFAIIIIVVNCLLKNILLFGFGIAM